MAVVDVVNVVVFGFLGGVIWESLRIWKNRIKIDRSEMFLLISYGIIGLVCALLFSLFGFYKSTLSAVVSFLVGYVGSDIVNSLLKISKVSKKRIIGILLAIVLVFLASYFYPQYYFFGRGGEEFPLVYAILLGFFGGAMRVFFGIAKQQWAFDAKRFLRVLIVSVLSGGLAAALIEGGWRIAIIAGFFGTDTIEVLWRGLARREGVVARPSVEHEIPANLNDRQKAGYEFILKYGKITNEQYQKLNKCSHNTAVNDFKQMINMRIIKRYGKGKGTYYKLS